MTIQLSVTVWTVICFIALMLILHNLLFKPVLLMLDKRNARIKDAEKKKAEYERIECENESLLIKSKKAFLENKFQEAKEKIEAIRAKSRNAVEEAQGQRINMVEEYRIKTDAEQEEILNVLEQQADSVARTFANSLIKG